MNKRNKLMVRTNKNTEEFKYIWDKMVELPKPMQNVQ